MPTVPLVASLVWDPSEIRKKNTKENQFMWPQKGAHWILFLEEFYSFPKVNILGDFSGKSSVLCSSTFSDVSLQGCGQDQGRGSKLHGQLCARWKGHPETKVQHMFCSLPGTQVFSPWWPWYLVVICSPSLFDHLSNFPHFTGQ